MKPTAVLVHGAFADSSSWTDVITALQDHDLDVVAYANPLRSVQSDAAGLTALLRTLTGPVVLVGHSYGGAVLSAVPAVAANITALVYVAAFALESGESAADAAGSVPGSTLGETLRTVPLADAAVDASIDPARYHAQFCANLPEATGRLLAVTQRPITIGALNEPLDTTPLWKSVPSSFVFGDQDLNIPVGAHRNMAARANAVDTIEIAGGSHLVGASHSTQIAQLIAHAALAHQEQPA